ncbi:MAG TPA: alpha/beta hydrolase [Chthoniobacterales bacterium]|nr:alpha/beta hydrolase [Chthoniobacterales bacterium]
MRPWRSSISLTLVALAGVYCFYSLGGCGKHGGSRAAGKLKPCRLAGIEEELLCGKLTVFENRQRRTGRTIDLHVVVLPALDPKQKEEPLFDLAGGPGAASTEGAPFYAGEGKEYRRHRDVVLVDQRGTGESNGLKAALRRKTPQDFLTEMYPVEYVQRLRQTLEPRADLTHYTTSIAMDDLDDARAWLGYERIHLFGLSYGTRAALVYLRQHPDRVRTVTLMGVAPTDLKMPLYHAQAAARALELLLKECESDARCHEAFPQIRQDWQTVLAQLGREPARVSYSPPDQSAPVTVEIQRDIFAEKVRTMMYGADKARRIPFMVHRAATGDFAPFLQEVIKPSIPDFIADGMYLSVTCAEDVPFIDQAEAAKLNVGNPFGNYRVFQQTRACGLWPRGHIPPDFQEPVSSNVPVLIFSGGMDPVTPPERGAEVAKYLPKSRHVIIPHGGHGLDGLTSVDCADRVIMEFLRSGDAKSLDTGCVETMAPPPFATK